MITLQEVRLLTYLTKATLSDILALQASLPQDASTNQICNHANLQHPDDALIGLHLRPKQERADALSNLVRTMNPKQFAWIREVVGTSWDHDSGSTAYGLFHRGEQLGIPGVATYSIVAASMTLQRFPVPKNLGGSLQAARKAVHAQREHVASSAHTPEQIAMLKEAQAKYSWSEPSSD